ncbi:hypothetical protein HDE_02110 [Halotydeus destructor]|nr:hypothetical protein HDE_02110 [Halotydeus destructor]
MGDASVEEGHVKDRCSIESKSVEAEEEGHVAHEASHECEGGHEVDASGHEMLPPPATESEESSVPLKKRKFSPPSVQFTDSAQLETVVQLPQSTTEEPKMASTQVTIDTEDKEQCSSSNMKTNTGDHVTVKLESISEVSAVTTSVAPPPIPVPATGRGQSKGMGCGRPGYITCSICNATKYYSHVQRRFGQFSCEPCSKFMKRFLRDPKQYTCHEDGHCTIGCAPGEQEPRGVSVSRCKACWLQICLDKFVLEPSTREVIDQHYLPKFPGRSADGAAPLRLAKQSAKPNSTIKSNSSLSSTPSSGLSSASVHSVDSVEGPPLPLPQRKRKQKEEAVTGPQAANQRLQGPPANRKLTPPSGQANGPSVAGNGRRTRKTNGSVRYKQAGATPGGKPTKKTTLASGARSRAMYIDENQESDQELLSLTTPSPPSTALFEPIYPAKRTKSTTAKSSSSLTTTRNRKRPVYAPTAFEMPQKLVVDYDDGEGNVETTPFDLVSSSSLMSNAMRSRSSSPFLGMGYNDHDYGYVKPGSPELATADCGTTAAGDSLCYQCVNSSKRHAFEMELDSLVTKSVVVMKETCTCSSASGNAARARSRITTGGKNGPPTSYLSAMAHAANVPEPESPKPGTKADTLGLELTIPSLYSASDIMMGIEPAATEPEVEVCFTKEDSNLNSLARPRSPMLTFLGHSPPSSRPLNSSNGRSSKPRTKIVSKPLKKVLLSSYRSFRTVRNSTLDSDDEFLEHVDRETRESLFFDEILNANSPFL